MPRAIRRIAPTSGNSSLKLASSLVLRGRKPIGFGFRRSGARRGKFHAIRTKIDGVTFASKKEARRYLVLKDERERGLITDLELQPRYPLYVSAIAQLSRESIDVTKAGDEYQTFKPGRLLVQLARDGVQVCTYVADFRYRRGGVSIVEDVKGLRLPLYKLKAKMLKAQYGIEIFET